MAAFELDHVAVAVTSELAPPTVTAVADRALDSAPVVPLLLERIRAVAERVT
jgi:hypothetical protein